MKDTAITFILITGFLLYSVLHILGGLDLSLVKCFYLLPAFLFFANQLWVNRDNKAAYFVGYSCLTMMFFCLGMINLNIIKNGYPTLAAFIGLNIVILFIRYR